MAYATPRTWVAGDVLTAAQLNQDVRDNISFLANPPACRIYHNTTQAIADATQTTVTFNSERYDTAAMHDTGTNPSRITIPVAGLYQVGFVAEFAAGTDYLALLSRCLMDGATIIGQSQVSRHDSGDGISASTSFGFTYKFTAAQYIEARVYQNNGANVARNLLSSANCSPEFWATRIGIG